MHAKSFQNFVGITNMNDVTKNFMQNGGPYNYETSRLPHCLDNWLIDGEQELFSVQS
jgi:hypothetical protein